MSTAEVETVEGDGESSPSSLKKGKKKYYPFGTSTSQAYSDFAHIKNPSTQAFASTLATGDVGAPPIEPVQEKVRRAPKKASTSKPTTAQSTAPPENPAAAIPDAEGLEPCTKIPCQLVLRAISEIVVKNEIERDEIEDDYDRLLQELAQSEQEVAAAEAKLQLLNDIGGQLEQRNAQLHSKVEALQASSEQQTTERNDISNKVTVVPIFAVSFRVDFVVTVLAITDYGVADREEQTHENSG